MGTMISGPYVRTEVEHMRKRAEFARAMLENPTPQKAKIASRDLADILSSADRVLAEIDKHSGSDVDGWASLTVRKRGWCPGPHLLRGQYE